MIYTVKGFSIVNDTDVDVFCFVLFLKFSCFFYDPNGCWQFDLWFLCLFYIQLETSGSSQFKYCCLAWKILSITLEVMSPIVWQFEYFFGISFLWDWKENAFFNPVATAEFSKFAGILSETL